jgi:hypothetical protein
MNLLVRFVSTKSRRVLLSEFFANIAVAWFIAAFVASAGLLTKIEAFVNMILFLVVALLIRKN